MPKEYKVVILGAGPGGYVAAIRAAQLGLSVCLIEKDKLGGVCLNSGCIPTKTLVKAVGVLEQIKHAARLGIRTENLSFDFLHCQQRKEAVVEQLRKGIEFLLKKRGVDVIYGQGKIIDEHLIEVNEEKLRFKNCIVAIGSRHRELEAIKVDKNKGILSSNEILELKSIPKSLLVIGGGNIGCEFAYIFNRLGSKVIIVELTSQILPNEDSEIVQHLAADFKKNGITVFTGTGVKTVKELSQGTVEAVLDSGEKILTEKVLLAVGRGPHAEDCGMEKLGIGKDKGRILVNQRMQTNISNLYAIGDVVGRFYLAHVASREGLVTAENIAGHDVEMNYQYVPRCVYTSPELASAGINEKQAKEQGKSIKVGRFPFSASGKAVIEQKAQGMVKIIADAQCDKILGAVVYGPQATELISEICVAMEAGFTSRQLSRVIYAHPTLSEAVMEAAEAVENMAIHVA